MGSIQSIPIVSQHRITHVQSHTTKVGTMTIVHDASFARDCLVLSDRLVLSARSNVTFILAGQPTAY